MPTLLTSGLVIEHLTFAVRNYRHRRRGANEMVMKLTRLSDKAMKARSNIEALDQAYDEFNAKASNHATEVGELTEQIGEMQSDLGFSVTTLGNSVASSNAGATEKAKEQAGETQVITAADVGKVETVVTDTADNWPGKHQGLPRVESGQ